MKILPIPNQRYTNGVTTFARDFEKIVVPFTKNISGTLALCSTGIKEKDWHDKLNIMVVHNETSMYPTAEKIKFITHHGWWHDLFSDKADVRFVAQSIDLDMIPKPHENKKGIVFFGNKYNGKGELYKKLKDVTDVEFVGERKNEPQADILEYVNKFEIGVGVGRCAIEMLAMGLKVIVAGNTYGGYIINSISLKDHLYWNLNSKHFSNTKGGFLRDIEFLQDTKLDVNLNLIDMKNRVSNYIDAITK